MKKLNSFFSYIIKKSKHNWGLKLLSLFFAIILWNSAVVQADPVRPVTYDDIPITVCRNRAIFRKRPGSCGKYFFLCYNCQSDFEYK